MEEVCHRSVSVSVSGERSRLVYMFTVTDKTTFSRIKAGFDPAGPPAGSKPAVRASGCLTALLPTGHQQEDGDEPQA